MSEALKVLNNIRTLRAQARETDLETLEEMRKRQVTAACDSSPGIASLELRLI